MKKDRTLQTKNDEFIEYENIQKKVPALLKELDSYFEESANNWKEIIEDIAILLQSTAEISVSQSHLLQRVATKVQRRRAMEQ